MTWTVTRVDREDLHAVANIHCAAFPSRALSKLGSEAVRRYYDWQLTGPHDCVAVGVRADGDLGAFCFCGVFHGALSGFLDANRTYLGWRILTHPLLVTNSLVRSRIRLALAGRGARRHTPIGNATGEEAEPRGFRCLSIAVHPRYARRGLARLMFEAVYDEARQRGHREMHLSVDTSNHHAIAVFKSLGWHRVPGGPAWRGQMERVLDCHADASSRGVP